MLKLEKINRILRLTTGLLIYFVSQNQIFAQTSIVHIENQMRIDKNTGLPAAIYNVNSGQYSGSPQFFRIFIKQSAYISIFITL